MTPDRRRPGGGSVPSGPVTLYLVRHAHAGDRYLWDGEDAERPLSDKGRRQTEALTEALAGEPITRVLTSPYVRCQQTVAPLAHRLTVPLEVDDALAEGTSGAEALTLARALRGTGAVLCSHGDVIPDLVRRAQGRGMHVPGKSGCAKGSVWTLQHWDGTGFATGIYTPIPGI